MKGGKAILVLLTALSLLAVPAYFAVKSRLESSLQMLERRVVTERLMRAEGLLDAALERAEGRALRLAMVAAAGEKPLESMYALEQGETLFLIDPAGSVLRSIPAPSEVSVPSPALIDAAAALLRAEEAESFASVLLEDGRPYTAAAAAIIPNKARSTAAGVLLLLRSVELDALSADLHLLDIKAFPADPEMLPPEARSRAAALSTPNSISFLSGGSANLAFKSAADFEGRPVLFFQAIVPTLTGKVLGDVLPALAAVCAVLGVLLLTVLPVAWHSGLLSSADSEPCLQEPAPVAAASSVEVDASPPRPGEAAQSENGGKYELSLGRQGAHPGTQMERLSEFLVELSQSLRTPLSSILGLVDLLLDSHSPSSTEEPLRQISQEALALQQVANNAGIFADLEGGCLDIKSAPFSLREVIGESLEVNQKAAERAKILLREEIARGLPEKVIGDRRLLRQVLTNLITHALSLSAEGSSIAVLVEQAENQGGKLRLRFSVADCLRKESRAFDHPASPLRPEAFKPKGWYSRGITYSISARIVARLGGELEVREREGVGRAVVFKLVLEQEGAAHAAGLHKEGKASDWLKAPKTWTAPPAARKANGDVRILVVEDNAVNRTLLDSLLKKQGFQVECAAAGRDALERAQGDGHFDLILMDCELPDLDGFEITKRIRSREQKSGGHVPIVALTALAMSGDQERCLSAGMDDYLAKPIDKSELARVLMLYLGSEK